MIGIFEYINLLPENISHALLRELAKVKHSRKDFVIKRYKNVKDLEGNIKSTEKPKRIEPWWFTSSTGAPCINVFYGRSGLPTVQ